MEYYTSLKLGPQQEMTPEGFLLCRDVPIARIGMQLYALDEVPIEKGLESYIVIERDPEEVFSAKTISSFAGKPVTNDHPTTEVTPANWRELVVGTVLDPRRGEGAMNDCIIAEMLITEPTAIAAVRDGKREVSCGYDCDYEQIEPGRGRQLNIVGNHVALVDEGRCGARCSIGDKTMKATAKKSVWDRIMTAFQARDEKEMKEAMKEAQDAMDEGEGGTHIHLNMPEGVNQKAGLDEAEGGDLGARLAKLEEMVAAIVAKLGGADKAKDESKEEEKKEEAKDEAKEEKKEEEVKDEQILGTLKETAPPGTNDAAVKFTKDSARLGDLFQSVLSEAEILAPGIKFPAFDAALSPNTTADQLCSLRRKALNHANTTEDGKYVLEPLLGKRTVDKLSCDEEKLIFAAAAASMRRMNNERTVASRQTSRANDDKGTEKKVLKTAADVNAANRAKYNQPKR